MQAKITISLETDVIQALKHYAWDEYRYYRIQAALIIRQELERKGYLEHDRNNQEAPGRTETGEGV